jgi:predicted RNA binding protein YcfA (HicA-like mRNA interferase family)
MGKQELYEELKQKLKNLRFKRLCLIAEAFGFQYKGGKGSHIIYIKEGI